jgi:hypothetical protein
MATPVISASSSILGFKRNEQFIFQPAATENPITWAAVGLPAGVSIDTPANFAATGVASTDIVTATGNTFANGDRVYFSSITGGSGLTANTVYFIRDETGDTFKLAATATGAAIDFSTDISAGTIRKVSSGAISGAFSVAGVYVVTVSATNADPATGTREFVFGVSSEVAVGGEAGSEVDAVVVQIELPSGKVKILGASSGEVREDGFPVSLFTFKEDDTRLLIVQFVDVSGARLDPDPDELRLVLKAFEPEGALISATDFEKVGTGVTAQFNLPVVITGSALAGELSNNEADPGTVVPCIADFEWERDITHNASPLTLRASSQTFGVTVARDIAS